MVTVGVVGAGAAGLATAYHLADSGAAVRVFERGRIGHKPCSGGIASFFYARTGLPPLPRDVIASELRGVTLVSPGGFRASQRLDRPYGWVTHRARLDCWLADLCREKGVEISERAPVRGVSENGSRAVLLTGRGRERYDYAVCAEGSGRSVSRGAGKPWDGWDRHIAQEYYIESADNEPDGITVVYSRRYAPCGYAWEFPGGGNILKVGVAVPAAVGGARKLLDRYMADRHPGAKVVRRLGAIVPTARMVDVLHTTRTALVGDSAGMCDPFTGGGLTNAMIAGRLLASCIASGTPLSGYGWEARREFRRLGRQYRLKKVLYRMSDDDIDSVLRTLSKHRVASLNPGREFFLAAMRVFLRHPGLLLSYIRG